MLLTGDMGAGLELRGHHGIHVDHDLFLLSMLGVTDFNLLSYPVFERLANDGGANVHDPLFRDLGDIGLVREVRRHLWLRLQVSKDLFKGEILVVRHVQCLHLRIWDVGLSLILDVFEVIDIDVL